MAHVVIQDIERYSYATRLDFSAKAGETSITVRAAVEGLVGKTIEVDPITNKERIVVSAVDGRKITFSPALSNAYAAGTLVRIVLGEGASGLMEEFVPIVSAWNVSSEIPIAREDVQDNGFKGWPGADNVYGLYHGNWRVPKDFVGTAKVYVMGVMVGGSGTVRSTLLADFASIDELWLTHSVTNTKDVNFTSSGFIYELCSLDLTGLSKGDFVFLQFENNGDASAYTYSGAVYITGFYIQYISSD